MLKFKILDDDVIQVITYHIPQSMKTSCEMKLVNFLDSIGNDCYTTLRDSFFIEKVTFDIYFKEIGQCLAFEMPNVLHNVFNKETGVYYKSMNF